MTKSRTSLYGVLVLAFLLRLINLDGRPIWYDEAFAILYAEKSFGAMLYGTLTPVSGAAADVHPLFYYSLLHLWMNVVGQSAFAVRFLSVAFGAATGAVVYRLARALFDRRAGAMTMLMLAVAPFHIAYSQEARMYAQLGFFSALALFAFVLYDQTRARRWWALFVGSGAGVVYSHNLGFLILLALGLWVLARREFALLRATALAGATIILLWLPWLALVPSQLGKIAQAYWVPRPDAVSLLQTLITFAVDFDNARLPALLLPFALFGALLILTITGYQVIRHPTRSVLLVVELALLPALLLFLLSQWRPLYLTRALIASFLALLVIVAWALVEVPFLMRRLTLAGAALLTLASLGLYYQYAEFPRPPFREALAFLASNARADEAIVHDNKLSYFPMHYYDPALAQSFIADPSGGGSDTLALPTQQALNLFATSMNKAVDGRSRIWFVIFEQAVQERGGNLAWLDQNYRLKQIERFNDLDLYLYEK
jgi:mannosyltransferase